MNGITEDKYQDNHLNTLRTALFKSIMGVRNGEMSANDANAVAKLSHQVIESYKTEIKAVEVANSLKDKNIRYADALPSLGRQDESK